MRKSICILIFALFGYLSAYCQEKADVLNLMNGQVVEGSILDTTNGIVKMQVPTRHKTRLYEFEHYRVYSYTQGKMPETILYRQDTAIGNFLTQQEMKHFFLGERDARLHYNPLGTKIAASLLTFGLSLSDTYSADTVSKKFFKGFFKSEPGVITIVAPLFATCLALLPAVQIRIDKVSDRNLLNEPSYLDGFEKIARSKKVFGALKFSVVGCLAGLASYYIFK